jgi:effector-binding domain-containing protein
MFRPWRAAAGVLDSIHTCAPSPMRVGSWGMQMTCRWRAITLIAVLTLATAPLAWGQGNTAPPPASTAPTTPAPGDPFGEELTLASKSIIYMKGNSTWDTALDTLVDAFKSVYAYLDKQGLKRAGPAMTIYTQADDTGFEFQAAVPIAETPKDTPKGDIALGTSPSGRALKFVHRGSYDAMDTTYEAITNYLDEKRLEAQDLFVEEYVTDPVTTPEDKFIVTVYVPIK